jgi:branched-chain amino acid transport system ATP-binding protein
MSAAVLKITNLTKTFGGIVANSNVNLTVRSGEIAGLIGPNGAGKSTLFKMICGVRPEGSSRLPDTGRITFMERDITRLKAHAICRMGMALVFQETEVLKNMSVIENVTIGALCHENSYHRAREKAETALALVDLIDHKNRSAKNLTLADKKRLELARALATRPKLLMLDEVMAGLTLTEVQESVKLLKKIGSSGITIVLIEHVLEAVMALAERIVVMDQGAVIADAPPRQVVEDPNVIQAYLGKEVTDA